MNNTVIFKMKNWIVDDTGTPPDIGYDGENKVTTFEIQADVLPGSFTYFLDIFDLIDRDYVALERDGNTLRVLLTEGMLGPQGLKTLQIRAIGEDGEVKKSNCFHAVVLKSVNATDEYSDPLPSAFDEYEARIRAMYEDVSGITGYQMVNDGRGNLKVYCSGGAEVRNTDGNLVFIM